MKKRTSLIVLAFAFAAAVGAYIVLKPLIATSLAEGWKPSWREHLPATATDIHEWSWTDGFLPDYSYQLKARMSEEDFRGFVKQLGLTLHTPDRQYSEASMMWLAWRTTPRLAGREWWDMSNSLDSTFVSEGHSTWSFAKYENGYLYFHSLEH